MRQEAYRMQQAGTRQGAHRRAPARHLPAGRLALCRSLHTAITRFLGRFSWSCGYKAQAAIEQKLEPTLFGSTLDKSRHYGDNNKTPTILARALEHWVCLGTVWRLRCPSTVSGVMSDNHRLKPGFWPSLSAWPADRLVSPADSRAWHSVHSTESTHGPAAP
jgi:hypothetical protein